MNNKIMKSIMEQAKVEAEQKKQEWVQVLGIEGYSYDGMYPSEKDFLEDALIELIKDMLWLSLDNRSIKDIPDVVLSNIEAMAINLAVSILKKQ